MKVIQFKNKKLFECLEQRQAIEDELREKIEKLEKRQATDDATLLIVNRYWTQVKLMYCVIGVQLIYFMSHSVQMCVIISCYLNLCELE